jgi:NAD(P)-dependent dehydrogenase (short-subunit alcohol dehydrogenase family)
MDGIRELAASLSAREPALHVLVNNAGAAWGEALDAFPESGWDKVMDINVKGPFFLVQALLPLLEAAATAEDPARIINIGSIDGLKVSRLPTFSYGPSKAAIHHLTRMLAVSLADRFITCNAIAPGPFPSKMMEHTLETMGDEIRAAVPLKRIGQASDIAGTAIFLASAAGAYVTGAVIPLDGGTVAAGRSL